TLELDGGGTHSGSFNIAAGGTLALDAPGVQTFSANSSLTGAGTLAIYTDVTASGAYNMTGELYLANGTLTAPGNWTVPFLHWAGGTLSGAGTTTIPAGGTLTIEGYTTKRLSGQTFNNAGSASLSGNHLTLANGAVFNNQPGATFTLQDD